jgi:hypothetical protein
MNPGQVRKPRISPGKPVRRPDRAFGNLTHVRLAGGVVETGGNGENRDSSVSCCWRGSQWPGPPVEGVNLRKTRRLPRLATFGGGAQLLRGSQLPLFEINSASRLVQSGPLRKESGTFLTAPVVRQRFGSDYRLLIAWCYGPTATRRWTIGCRRGQTACVLVCGVRARAVQSNCALSCQGVGNRGSLR